MNRVAVCIATYKRPEGLNDLLDSITQIDSHGLEIYTIVVDNDAGKSASAVINRYENLLPNLIYEVEPVQGISYARNKNVRIAHTINADFVAFVDDDEVVNPNWLRELMKTQRLYHADVVFGPVIPEFDPEIPRWITNGGFYERKSPPTGSVAGFTGVGNTLIRMKKLDAIDGPFDTSMSRGEDTMLFMHLRRLGTKMIWCDTAKVVETIPIGRATIKWLVWRSLFDNNQYVFCEIKNSPKNRGRIVRLLKGFTHLTFGLLATLISLFLGRTRLLQSIRWAAKGSGMIIGTLGYKMNWTA